MDKKIQDLVEFLDAAHSVYHAAAYLSDMLQKAGYTRLSETENWELVPGGKYFMVRGGTSVVAFRIPGVAPKGFMMTASHSDRPTFKVKENGELCGTYTRLATEKYGGMLMATWLDRPLSVAGRVTVETETGVKNVLVDIDRDLAVMPNVAIHMDRSANDGRAWNPAVDTVCLLGSKDAKGKLDKLLTELAGGKILGRDLYLYVRQKASVWGVDGEYISAAALDDLECAWGCTRGFLAAKETGNIPLLCVFDSEEVGSSSTQGAASTLLEDVLERICKARNLPLEQLLAQSFMVSADNAHAVHPNHPEYADSANAPVLGEGIAVKFNANLRYATDGVSAAIFRKICTKAQVPVQNYLNRADLPGGSTLGHISLSHVSVPTVDIGLPQLAMHSAYETAAVKDAIYLQNAMTAYYSTDLSACEDGYTLG